MINARKFKQLQKINKIDTKPQQQKSAYDTSTDIANITEIKLVDVNSVKNALFNNAEP